MCKKRVSECSMLLEYSMFTGQCPRPDSQLARSKDGENHRFHFWSRQGWSGKAWFAFSSSERIKNRMKESTNILAGSFKAIPAVPDRL